MLSCHDFIKVCMSLGKKALNKHKEKREYYMEKLYDDSGSLPHEAK